MFTAIMVVVPTEREGDWPVCSAHFCHLNHFCHSSPVLSIHINRFCQPRHFCQLLSTFVNSELTSFVNNINHLCRYRRGHYFCQQGPTTFVDATMVSSQFGAFHFGARQFGAFHVDAVPVRRVSLWRDASLARFPFLCLTAQKSFLRQFGTYLVSRLCLSNMREYDV